MKFILEDKNQLQFDFDAKLGKVIKVSVENREIDLDNIQKSFLAGSVVKGEKRIASNDLILEFDINAKDDDTFRPILNELLFAARNAVFLLDTENDIRTKITLSAIEIPWDAGSRLRGTSGALTFIQETPYWEDIPQIELNESGSSISTVIDNTGFLETPAVFTLVTTVATAGFEIFITETAAGVEIQDLSFGVDPELLTYILNNETGESLLGGINRNDRIRGGSGFFQFPVGVFTLNIESDQSLDVNIKYRRRFWV